jgi:hypothetical protein
MLSWFLFSCSGNAGMIFGTDVLQPPRTSRSGRWPEGTLPLGTA